MAKMGNNGPVNNIKLPVWSVGYEAKKEENKDKEEVLRSIIPEHTKESVKKATSTPAKTNTATKTNTAPFKPRTLLETTITRGNDNTKVNTNNRFESRFTPRTINTNRINELDNELKRLDAMLSAELKARKGKPDNQRYSSVTNSRVDSDTIIEHYKSSIERLRKEKDALVKSKVLHSAGLVKTMDSVSAVEDLRLLTRNDVERARAAEQKREDERKKRYQEDAAKAEEFWKKQKEKQSDPTYGVWRPEFDRTGAYKKDSDNDEVNELAKDPKKLKIADGSKEAEYYVKGWAESQKDYKHEALYLDKRTDRDNEIPLSYVMNQSEYDALMYVRGKYGDDEAERFLKVSGIQDRKIKAEYDVKYREQMIQQGKERPVASLLGTVVSAVPHAAAGVSYTLKKMANERAGYEKHDTSSEEDWFNNNVQDLWQEGRLLSTDDETIKAIYTGADMVARNLVEMSTGGAVGKLAKGLGAGKRAVEAAKIVGEGVVAFGTGSADKYTEQAQYGTLGKKGSVSTGVIAGAMDALSWGLMRKGTDKLAGKMFGRMSQGALKTVLSNTVGSVLSGAGIGVTRQTIDNLSDHFIMQNNSKYDVLVKNFQQNGMGQDEAEKNAFIEAYVRPMGSAIMAGGLLSATMTAYGTVRNAVSFTMRGAKVKNDLYNIKPKDISNEDIDRSIENAVIKHGLKQDKNSEAYKNAKLLENKVNNKRVLSNSEIGAQDILNQIEEFKTYEYAAAMSELTDAKVEFGAVLPPEADGSYLKGTIKVSENNQRDARTVIKHEGGHLAEDGAGDIYNAYKARLKDNVTFTKVTNKIKEQYDALGKSISNDALESEAAAEIGRLLMPKTADDVRRLIRRVEGNPTLYDRMHNRIRNLRIKMYAKGKKTFYDPETGFKMNYGEMLKLEKTLEDALVKVRSAELKSSEVSFSYGIKQQDINNYVDSAYKKENKQDYMKYAKPSERLKSDLENDISLDGYSHALRDNDIRHIKNSHGEQTNEKYPVSSEDIKKIPYIVQNYDKVFYKTNANGEDGVVYVKVMPDNVVYYVEAVTTQYHNEKLLVNKQMVKTGIDDVPNLYGLKKAINRKQSEAQYLADLKEIRKAYVQDVKEQNSVTNNISQSNPNVKYSLKTNLDTVVYGRNIKNDLDIYNREKMYGKTFSKLAEGELPDAIREAYALYNQNRFDEAYDVLYKAGLEVEDSLKGSQKKGKNEGDIAKDFADSFEKMYQSARKYNVYQGKYAEAKSDISEFNTNVPAYVTRLATSEYAELGVRDTLDVENTIRDAYRAIAGGANDSSAKDYVRPAAEKIVDNAKDGYGKQKYSAEERAEAIEKISNEIVSHYYDEQPAKKTTAPEIAAEDKLKYGKDVEGIFRDMELSNATEGEIKRLANVTRQMIDYVTNEHNYSVEDFRAKLDKIVGEEVSKHKHNTDEMVNIANTVIAELRQISLEDIGKRRHNAYSTMQAEATAHRTDGEVYRTAKAEYDECKRQEALLTGIFSDGSTNVYALSSPGKKSHRVVFGEEVKGEFDSVINNRISELTYRVVSNKESAEYGMNYVATHDNYDTFTYLANKPDWDSKDMATAAALMGEFGVLGESERAADVFIMAQKRATQAGQMSQAFRLFYCMTPEGTIAWWIKSNDKAIEKQIDSRNNKDALHAKRAEAEDADAREREAADKHLYESNGEYRAIKDEESRLKKDLAEREAGRKKAEAKIAELEAKRNKKEKEYEFLAFMLGADERATERGRARVTEARRKELLKNLEIDEADIDVILKDAMIKPGEYDEFFTLIEAYYKVSGREAKDILKQMRNAKDRATFIEMLEKQKGLSADVLEEIKTEYGDTLKRQSEHENEMKVLRREVREIRKKQHTMQNETIMRVIRVNDDGEVDPNGAHFVSDNPKATEWEMKKSQGISDGKSAYVHFKSHLDEFYEKAGINHIESDNIMLLKELAGAVHDIEDVDDMLNVIMDLSKIRNTATGSWREALSSKSDAIRSKMYRGIEKLGTLGFDNYVENLANRDGVTVKYKREDLPQVNPQLYKYLATINGKSSPENSISQGGGKVKTKEHNPIKRNLKKAFGDDVEALRDIAINQMFGVLSDMDTRSLGAKAKTGMFIVQLMNVPTTFRNLISNAVEGGRMNIVNNLGALIERVVTPKGERTIGWENVFSGGKAGWERMRKSRLETALNVDILKNDTSRLGTPLKKRTFTKGPMAVLERGLGYLLGATDEYFKGTTEYQVKQGLKRYVDNGRITQAEADKYAEEQMLYRTFQNDSNIARASQMIRDAGNVLLGVGEKSGKYGVREFGLGDFINAYPLVSGNVLDRVIDVTPVGALKVIYNSYKLAEDTYKNKRDIKAIEMPIGGKVSEESKTAAAEAIKTNHDLKRKTILSLSSALTNGALIWAGMALFKNGIITGNPSADEEEDYERAKNNSQYGINISRLGRLLDGDDDGTPKNGDLIMPVGFLGNIYMGLSVGAELVQGNEQEMNFLDNYFSSNVMSAKEQFLSMSMISNCNRIWNNFTYSDSVGEGAVATLADVGMMGMPSVVRQFSNAMDDYGRDPYKGATYLDIISGKFKSKIPKVREGEPLRIDLFGEAEVHTLGNKWADIGNNMLSPGIISKYETNVVTQELDKLTAKNKDLLKEILPKTPYRNNTGEFENGQAYSFKLDDENYEKYANLLGMTTYKAMHTLVTSDDYKHLTDTQKTTALAEISKESAELVKEIWVSHQQGASDSSMQKRIDKYVDSNKAKASKVVKTDNALKYIKLDGVKVEDVIDAGYRVPYTEEEKGEQIAYNYSMISKIRNGTYYDKSSRKYSSSLTAEQRQQLINSFVRSSEDLASGIEQKWISITGEFKNLTDKEKGIVIDQIGYNIDKVRLPDNVGELVDTSVETEPVDLTYPFVPRNSNIIDTGWRADEYDREQAEEKKAEAAEEEDANPESKSVEEYLSEYKGSGGGNSGYSRNYSKKSYNNSYGGGYSSGSSYRFTPSVQPVQKNTYRFTPRFGGSGSRFGKKF